MITEQHRQDFDRLRPYCQGKRMLMLGRQESTIGDPAALFQSPQQIYNHGRPAGIQ